MRYLALAAFLLASGAAHASSIQPLTTHASGATKSVVSKSCGNCPPLKPTEDVLYKVPVLKEGVQSVAVMEIDGEKKIVRTEHWLGGSPVIHINKVPEWMSTEQLRAVVTTEQGKSTEAAVEAAAGRLDPIDFNARTGAVEPDTDTALKPDDFPLRLK